MTQNYNRSRVISIFTDMEVTNKVGFEKEQRPSMKTFDERYRIQAVTSTGTTILGYGVSTLSSTKPGALIFRIDPPLYAGVDKTIIALVQSGSSSSFRVIPNTTAITFRSTGAGTRACTFSSTGESAQFIATSVTRYHCVSNMGTTFGTS
jgi:hypothetical protein